MNNFNFSKNAMKVIHLFHKNKFILYVEGEDDELFWGELLKKANIESYIIKQQGGKSQLEKYIEMIKADDVKMAVAIDRDYSDFTGDIVNNEKIFYTYGHSIENSLYCPKTIERVIKSFAKKQVVSDCEIEKWLNDSVETLKDLLIMDIANEKYNKGLAILGDNSCRFLTKNSSINLSAAKINKAIDTFKDKFSDEELRFVDYLLKQNEKPLRFIIRGHFLTNIVINYVKEMALTNGKSVVIPKDNFFALVINQFSENICQRNCVGTVVDKIVETYRKCFQLECNPAVT